MENKYLLALALGTKHKVEFKCVENPVDFDLIELKKFDTVVFNIQSSRENLMPKLESFRSGKCQTTVILLFSRHEDLIMMFALLKNSTVKSLHQPKMISFLNPNPVVGGEYSENMIYGLILCEVIYGAPLLDFNGPVSNIDVVVNQVTPPESRLAFVNEGSLVISSIHSEYFCLYIGEKIVLDKYRLSIGEGSVDDDIGDHPDIMGDETLADIVVASVDEVDATFEPEACSTFLVSSSQSKTHESSELDGVNGSNSPIVKVGNKHHIESDTCSDEEKDEEENDEEESEESEESAGEENGEEGEEEDDEEDEEEGGEGDGFEDKDCDENGEITQVEKTGFDTARYKRFTEMLHKFIDETGRESVEIDVIRNYFKGQIESDPVLDEEFDIFITNLVSENRGFIVDKDEENEGKISGSIVLVT